MSEIRTLAVRLLPGHFWEELDVIKTNGAREHDDTHNGQAVRYYTGTYSQLAGTSKATLLSCVDKCGYISKPFLYDDDGLLIVTQALRADS